MIKVLLLDMIFNAYSLKPWKFMYFWYKCCPFADVTWCMDFQKRRSPSQKFRIVVWTFEQTWLILKYTKSEPKSFWSRKKTVYKPLIEKKKNQLFCKNVNYGNSNIWRQKYFGHFRPTYIGGFTTLSPPPLCTFVYFELDFYKSD